MQEASKDTIIGYLEDDAVIRDNFTELLESDGYRVKACATRDEALQHFEDPEIHLALLDVELEDDPKGGMEVCRALRRRRLRLPIIFLTSHTDAEMQSRGWRFGADDYVGKDTDLELILLRIRTLLRRYRELERSFREEAEERANSQDLIIDESRLCVVYRGTVLDLSLTQFWIVKALVESHGQPLSHADLQQAAHICVEANTIVSHIKNIRETFREIDPDFNRIRTERGRGYRWNHQDSGRMADR